MFVQSLTATSRSVQAATQADAIDATCDLVAGGSGADGGDGGPPGLRRMMRGAGGVPDTRGVGAGGGAGGGITGDGALPSLSRCATMMASSWSRTWGGGSSISRLSTSLTGHQEFNSMIQGSSMQKKILRGLLVYAQLTWAHSLSSRAKQRPKNSRSLREKPVAYRRSRVISHAVELEHPASIAWLQGEHY